MKRPLGLLVISFIGIAVDFCIGYFFFPVFLMLTQYYLAMLLGNSYYYVFYSILLSLLIFVFVVIYGLFKLKKWGRNIFIFVTVVMNFLVIFFFSRLAIFGIVITPVIIFLICFIIYFLKPSTRALFNK